MDRITAGYLADILGDIVTKIKTLKQKMDAHEFAKREHDHLSIIRDGIQKLFDDQLQKQPDDAGKGIDT